MTYQPTDHERAIYSWLKEVVGSVEVRFANQAAPRAGVPFVTLQVIADQPSQTAEVQATTRTLGDGYATEIHEHRVSTVSINVFGAAHRAIILKIERSISDPHIVDFNQTNNLSVQRAISGAQDLTALMATDYEGRSQQDFLCAWAQTWDSPFAGGAVLKSRATGTLNDLEFTHSEDYDEP